MEGALLLAPMRNRRRARPTAPGPTTQDTSVGRTHGNDRRIFRATSSTRPLDCHSIVAQPGTSERTIEPGVVFVVIRRQRIEEVHYRKLHCEARQQPARHVRAIHAVERITRVDVMIDLRVYGIGTLWI